MKNRILLLTLVISTMIFSGCEDDLPPEKTVGNITFVITEENTPQTLSGVSIQLFSDDDPSVTPTDRTDASGRCTFSNIPVGTYKMNLSKPGYESKEELTLRINGGDNPYKEISLKRATTVLTVAPDVLDFGDNESVIQKAFSLVNPNYQDLTWAVLDTVVDWIVSVCDKDGKKSGTIKYNQEVAMSVTIDRDSLPSGNNESTIVILSDYGRAELKVMAIGEERALPKLNVLDATNVTSTSATFNAKIIDAGTPAYTIRGFVYSLNEMPSFDNMISKLTSPVTDDAEFSYKVNGLTLGETYYVRAFATNEIGTEYSANQIAFTTKATEPKVTIDTVSDYDVNNASVVFNGTVSNVGDPAYEEKGFVYSLSNNPTTTDLFIRVGGTSEGVYSAKVNNLQLDKMYYVRAYVISEGVVYYSQQQETFILETTSPSLEMMSVTGTSYSEKRAKFTGQILSKGTPSYSTRGFVYSYNSNPTIEDNYEVVDGSGTSSFSVTISNLVTQQKYYVRAFAEQNGKYFYSDNEIDFVLEPIQAQVGNTSVSDIGTNTAKLSSTMEVVGDPVYSEKGFVYHTESNPTVISNKDRVVVYGSDDGHFSAIISNLSQNTTYYARAYVIQSDNIYYGPVMPFETGKYDLVVNTNEASDVMYTTATLNGAIISAGDYGYEQRGFYYGTNSSPTSNNSNTYVEYANASGSYEYKVSGLKEKTKYYFRAFVIQPGDTNGDANIKMGEVLSFTTGQAPNVTTGGVINVSCTGSNEASLNWSVTLYGGLSDVGDPAYTEFGFVYGKKNQPSVNDGTSAYTTTSQFDWNENVRVFHVDISGLVTGQHYYIRAVAKTPLGYIYGEQIEFTPAVISPVIRTYSADCQYIDGTGWAAALIGVAGSLGQPAATGLGFVYGLESMPTVGDGVSKSVSYTKIEKQGDYYVYGVAVTGLQAGKEYYFRTYAKTPLGYTYGEPLVFRTY